MQRVSTGNQVYGRWQMKTTRRNDTIPCICYSERLVGPGPSMPLGAVVGGVVAAVVVVVIIGLVLIVLIKRR